MHLIEYDLVYYLSYKMPKSKRNRVVPLNKVASKKGISDRKVKLVSKVEKHLKEYSYCFVFTYKNMTNMSMQALKDYFNDSIFVLGKNRVEQKALEENKKPNSSKLFIFVLSYIYSFFIFL